MVMDISPLDFPQVYQKPPAAALLETLQSLELSPPIWNHKSKKEDIIEHQESLASQKKAEVTRYLSTIIGSELSWLADEEEREAVWTQASKRMTERCGRTAMGEVIRRWPFEGSSWTKRPESEGVDDVDAPFELVIREPALTGDSLGFKTWGSSYVLAQDLPRLAASPLAHIFQSSAPVSAPPTVVELGSGTGLLGLAAAAYWRVEIALSDLPNIVSNLRVNAEKNKETIEARGGKVKVGDLTWGGEEDEIDQELFGRHHQFEIVLVADPMYDDDHPVLLASAISQHLALGSKSRAVVMVPQRDATTVGLLESFKSAMLNLDSPIFCIEEDYELNGQDDWGDDDGGHVKCWLGIFARRSRS